MRCGRAEGGRGRARCTFGRHHDEADTVIERVVDRAESLDRERRLIALASGEALEYGALLRDGAARG